MAERPPLFIAFTMDCHPATSKAAPEGPRSWEQSAAAIDGYWTRLARGGYAVTLFLTPRVAEFHAPLLEEAAEVGVELGLYLQPQSLEGSSYNRFLGHYAGEEQRTIIARALEGFQDALGRRPQSARPAMFSANDDTYPSLFELGFRQGSVSSPGRKVGSHVANWSEAFPDAHYVSPQDRLVAGDLPFLEVPVTTDPSHRQGGVAPNLTVENGTLALWHRPLIEAQLQRMDRGGVDFQVLCFTTRNVFAYHQSADPVSRTLDDIVDYLDVLSDRYEIHPVTLSQVHAAYRGVRGR